MWKKLVIYKVYSSTVIDAHWAWLRFEVWLNQQTWNYSIQPYVTKRQTSGVTRNSLILQRRISLISNHSLDVWRLVVKVIPLYLLRSTFDVWSLRLSPCTSEAPRLTLGQVILLYLLRSTFDFWSSCPLYLLRSTFDVWSLRLSPWTSEAPRLTFGQVIPLYLLRSTFDVWSP
jgi:hypothetical protein